MEEDMCTNRTGVEHQDSLVVARGLTAAAGSSLTTAAVIYISVQRAFRTPLQRLVLALTLATAVNLLAMTMQIHVGGVVYCAVTGFLVQFTSNVSVVLVTGTVLYLWHIVRLASRLRRPHTPSPTPHRVEVLFYLSSLLLPLSLDWLPFLGNHYGQASAWCWIKGCSTRGLVYQTLLGFLPTTLTCALTSSLVAGISCRYLAWAHKYRLQRQTLLIEAAEVSLLLLYLLCYAVFSVFEIACGVVVRRRIVRYFWIHMTYAITRPLLLALVPLSLLLYLYSTRRVVQRLLMWCSCLRPLHSDSARERPRNGEERVKEKKGLLRGSGGRGAVYSSSSPAVTGINHQSSIENEEDDDPLYSTIDGPSGT